MMHDTPFPSVTKEPWRCDDRADCLNLVIINYYHYYFCYELFLMAALKNICYTVYILFHHEQENFFAIQYFLIQCSNIGVV